MFNRKVLGALASVVALLLLLQAAFVIVLSVMAYAGNPVNLDPSVSQALALLQQLGTVAFLYVVLGAAARLATKKDGKDTMMMPTHSASKSTTAKTSSSKPSAKTSTSTRKSTSKKSSSRSKKK